MHDTYYHPIFWGIHSDEEGLPKEEQIDRMMNRAIEYAQYQYQSVKRYLDSIQVDKPIHIGETGWASHANDHYGNEGSRATDEYKEAIYYQKIMEWSQKDGITVFYFEAFDECWKDAPNPQGCENHFGLFTVDGEAKYVLWNEVDKGTFKNLKRDLKPIQKTYKGNMKNLIEEVQIKHN
jgi:Glycosyl hydrolases family 17